jgi:16S rRNA (guanine966-N2)-methyltransferase
MTAYRGEVRLIGGQWKRSKLSVPDRAGLRPTPDRVRETLFNWLGQDLTGMRCLDAFAGSGALGFEAASRGAAEVLLLERDRSLVVTLQAHKQRLRADALQVMCTDAMTWMRAAPAERFEVIFLDPPFDAELHAPALAAAAPLLVPDGLVYIETGKPLQQWPDTLQPWRDGRAGAVHVRLLRRRYTASHAPSPSRGDPA